MHNGFLLGQMFLDGGIPCFNLLGNFLAGFQNSPFGQCLPVYYFEALTGPFQGQ
jgi:hypothetical protein